ncbi:hypothetical protein LOZ53_005428, partial [Ophidiomyces ophidiicola]
HENHDDGDLVAGFQLQTEDLVDGQKEDDEVGDDVDEGVGEPGDVVADAGELAGAGPEGGHGPALPDGGADVGDGGDDGEGDHAEARPGEVFGHGEHADVEQEDGHFGEADDDFVEDLGDEDGLPEIESTGRRWKYHEQGAGAHLERLRLLLLGEAEVMLAVSMLDSCKGDD